MALSDEFSADDAAQVLSLVHQYIVNDLSSWSYVYAHKRKMPEGEYAGFSTTVGGYWRRKPNCRSALRAIPCVCKMHVVADGALPPPQKLWL